MGCHSGKASSPAAAPQAPVSAENTLLASSQAQSSIKESLKEVQSGPPVYNCGVPVFDGMWSNGTISGDQLIWSDGTVSQLRIEEVTNIAEVTYQGKHFRGELRKDGKIYWDDGDMWYRQPAAAMQGDVGVPTMQVIDTGAAHDDNGVDSANLIRECDHSNQASAASVNHQASPAHDVALQAYEAKIKDWRTQVDERKEVMSTDAATQSPKLHQAEVETIACAAQHPDTSSALHDKEEQLSLGKESSVAKQVAAPRKERGSCCC